MVKAGTTRRRLKSARRCVFRTYTVSALMWVQAFIEEVGRQTTDGKTSRAFPP